MCRDGLYFRREPMCTAEFLGALEHNTDQREILTERSNERYLVAGSVRIREWP